ncbi:hypothetical protein CM15mP35_10280 [bacterium]|nr:MAG: hypothetical protein CM15mP35_10280 [bacterium]
MIYVPLIQIKLELTVKGKKIQDKHGATYKNNE